MKASRAKHIQGLLHANGYHLKIDGIWGDNSQAALDKFAVDNHLYVENKEFISQKVLNALRGSIPKRTNAIVSAAAKADYRTSTVPGLPKSTDFNAMVRYFGHPDQIESMLVKVVPAYQLNYGDIPVSSIRVHPKCKAAYESVFKEILAAYGQEEIKRLGLNRYSGTYNKRKIRGGRSWSTHAFGIAIDKDSSRNRMGMSFKQAQFSKPEYKKYMDIWRANGFINLGEALNFDTMHFQYASV